MAQTERMHVVGFDGTYVYGLADAALQQRDASTLALISTLILGNPNGVGYMPFDGTYLYAPYDGGISKVDVSSMSVTATYASPTGAECFSLSFDGTYLYATFYDSSIAASKTLYKVEASTMTLVSSLALTSIHQILAPSLKYAVSPIL